MKEHLKKASENYNHMALDGVNPISKEDADIIVELCELFRKCNQPEIAQILGNWKKVQDKQVLDELIDYVINGDFEQGDEKWKKIFVLFDDVSLNIHYILSIGRKKVFKPELTEGYAGYEYQIVFNEYTSENTYYHNLTIKYKNKEERDKKYEQLHELLLDTGTIKFY